MTTEVISQALTAGQQATFGQGRVWYLKAATAPLSIVAETSRSGANIRKFINVSAGFKFTAPEGEGWTYLRVLSGVNQNIEIIIGDDDVEVSNAVSVTGGVTIQEIPSAGLTASVADVAVPTATASAIPANASRRRITVGALSSNTGSLRIQSTGAGASRGLELQPGTFVELKTAAAFDVRNDSGATQSYYVLEEI